MFQRIVRRAGQEPKLGDEFVAAHNSGSVDGIQPFPGVRPLLARWKQRGMKLFLVTDGLPDRQMKKTATDFLP